MDAEEITDYCSKCGNYFSIFDLVKDNRLKRGYKNLCKGCQSIQYKKYCEDNKDVLKKSRKKAYDKNVKPILNEFLTEKINKNPVRYKARTLKQSMIRSSKTREMIFDDDIVNVDFIYNYLLLNTNCECCRKKYSYEHVFNGLPNMDGPSIDRIDSTIGYVKNNITFICWECNNTKKDGTIDELQVLINWMKKIKNNGG